MRTTSTFSAWGIGPGRYPHSCAYFLRGRTIAQRPMLDAVSDPRALMDRLAAAQNAHDLEAMLACFQGAYHSEHPLLPFAHLGIERIELMG